MRHALVRAFVPLVLVGAVASAHEPLAALPTHTLYVPTTASIHGRSNTFFHTDLWAFNGSFSSSLTVAAHYRCFAGPCAGGSTTFTLAPRESKVFGDVGTTLFQLPETAGAIDLTYTSPAADLAVTTRTYTPSLPSPTYGTSIPALTGADARSRSVYLGLSNNGGDLGSGFRTNAGAFFASPELSTVVTYALYLGDGTLLGTTTQSLGAMKAGQINDVFSAVGAGSTVTTNAYLVITASLPILPFVTVIDNQSGDSVFVAPADDRPGPIAIELLANGGFDTGIGSWTNRNPPIITLAASSTDAQGRPPSGSLVVTNTFLSSGAGDGAAQCVPIAPGAVLDIRASMYIPPQVPTGEAEILVFFDGGPTCNGTYLGRCYTQAVRETGSWVTESATCSVPAGTQSTEILAFTSKHQGDGGYVVYFDDISVARSTR